MLYINTIVTYKINILHNTSHTVFRFVVDYVTIIIDYNLKYNTIH